MRRALAAAGIAGVLAAAGCAASTPIPGTGAKPPPVVRLGYVPALTQAVAITAIQQHLFARELGPKVTLKVVAFSTDQAEASALAAGKLDAAYASPAAILAAITAAPGSLRLIAGAATGGAELVVASAITSPGKLSGHVLATTATTGPQATALRSWLTARHLAGPRHGQGPVTIRPLAPAAAVAAFRAGRIAGAWALAPADVEMTDAGGHVLYTQASAGPGAEPPATGLVVTTSFLDHHTAAVTALLKAHAIATGLLHGSLLQVIPALSRVLQASGIPLSSGVLAASLSQITFTDSPGVASLLPGTESTQYAALYDLAPLNLVLQALGQQPVTP